MQTAAAAVAATAATAAPAMATTGPVAVIAEANITSVALVMTGITLVGLVIGFALLFFEDQISE